MNHNFHDMIFIFRCTENIVSLCHQMNNQLGKDFLTKLSSVSSVNMFGVIGFTMFHQQLPLTSSTTGPKKPIIKLTAKTPQISLMTPKLHRLDEF
uniref:Uncharacterized protein n=1 Tax=Panagrolaimus sp. JU765 TaxID=591449 RepID=A0AC34QM21_9BILA